MDDIDPQQCQGIACARRSSVIGGPRTEHGPYVIDVDGVVWMVVRDGGMVTRADYTGPTSAGIAWLEATHGPLVSFDPVALREEVSDE